MDVITFPVKLLVVYRFYCMVLFHSQTRRHMIISSCPVVAMETFTFKLFPTFFALLDDMSMLFSQIESDTSTDRVHSAQIESALHR